MMEVEWEKRKLKHNVVLSVFQNCAKYVSSKSKRRELLARNIARSSKKNLKRSSKGALKAAA